MSKPEALAFQIYKSLISKKDGITIPIDLQAPSLVGTVQDDPFDNYIKEILTESMPNVEVVGSGKLTTPDVVIRDRSSNTIIGLEIKKLIQKPNGADSRGLTMDYNSSLPCGTTSIKVGKSVVDIPCFYLFALLATDSTSINTLILLDGDFLNNDFELHKASKLANESEYLHGPYQEGSVRHRAMYTYPNPLNYKISVFHRRMIFVAKTAEAETLNVSDHISDLILRKDKNGNNFSYSVVDLLKRSETQPNTIVGIFDDCKNRTKRERTSSSMPYINEL